MERRELNGRLPSLVTATWTLGLALALTEAAASALLGGAAPLGESAIGTLGSAAIAALAVLSVLGTVSILGVRPRAELAAVAVSSALGIFVATALWLMFRGWAVPRGSVDWLHLACFGAIGTAIAVLDFRSQTPDRRTRNGARRLALASWLVPGLFAGLAWLLLHKHAIEGIYTPAAWLANVAFASTALLIAYGWRRHAGAGHWAVRAVSTLLLVASVLFPLLSARPAVLRPAPASAPRVVLITVDTLRRDHLSCYGGVVRTPATDSVAADGILFDRAISPSPWTLPSVVSMMTGLSPLVHGVNRVDRVLDERIPTLAEVLLRHGMHTKALVSNPVLVSPNGVHRGFVEYDAFPALRRASIGLALLTRLGAIRPAERSTSDLATAAAEWIRSHGEGSFFLWLHLYDPHLPWQPPRHLLDAAQPRGEPLRVGLSEIRSGRLVPSSAQRSWARFMYGLEVRYVDESIGIVLDALRESGLYEKSLIVITSDHGEEFWEHGGFEHGHSLFGELLDVPLIIKPPGPAHQGLVERAVSTESLKATILEAVGLAIPAHLAPSLAGSWLAPARPDAEQPLLSSSLLYFDDGVSLVMDKKKLIRFAPERTQLFDLTSDPGEHHDLFGSEQDTDERLLTTLHSLQHRYAELRQELGLASETPQLPIDAGVEERLRALGYVQ